MELHESFKFQKLLGANRKCATEMQAQAIELPADVDQLQFLCLQLREELIETRAAKEHNVRFLFLTNLLPIPLVFDILLYFFVVSIIVVNDIF